MNTIEQYLYELTKRLHHLSLRIILMHIWYAIKRVRWILLLLICLILLHVYRSRIQLVVSQGEILGKPYQVTYWSKKATNYQADMDVLLADLVQVVDPDGADSMLKQFNQYDCRAFHLEKPFLYQLLDKSKAIYKATNGVFDPTVAPLVKLWKEHLSQGSKPAIHKILTLQEYVGLDYVVVNPQRIKRLKEGVSVDVQGLLHGYIVDTLAGLLQAHGVQNKLIKFGKQAVAYGKQDKDQGWLVRENVVLGVEHTDSVRIEVILQDQGMAIKTRVGGDGSKQSIIIDPVTGYPAQHELLAVVVFAKDGMSADAYGTAIMARGIAFAQSLAAAQKEVEILMVYQNTAGQIVYDTSDGLQMEHDADNQQIKLSLVKS